MLNKKLLLCFGVLLLSIPLSGCFSRNHVFAFDSDETEKIVINEVEITDSETIEEIAEIFAKISGEKVDGVVNESNYKYDFECYDADGHIIHHFLLDENGSLFKSGKYNDPDIFNRNFYYSAYLDSDDVQRIIEIIG